MTHRLTTNYAKNYCNRTLIVKVIAENAVTCFLGHGAYKHCNKLLIPFYDFQTTTGPKPAVTTTSVLGVLDLLELVASDSRLDAADEWTVRLDDSVNSDVAAAAIPFSGLSAVTRGTEDARERSRLPVVSDDVSDMAEENRTLIDTGQCR